MRVKSGVRSISPYQGGKPIEEVQRELGLTDVIKLAANENPLGPSKYAVDAMTETAKTVHLYPDGNAYYLKRELAAFHNVAPEQVVFGNGSCELLQLLGETFIEPGDEIAFSRQSFVMYPLVSRIFGAKAITPPLTNDTYDLDALAASITPETQLVFIANPNNPTGTYVTKRELNRFFERVPSEPLIVLDEAYFEYVEADDYPDGLDYLRAGHNVLVTRTFSKIYGLAGLRIGYGISTPQVIDWMNRARQPFNANLMAQEAARAALPDAEHVARSRELNRNGLAYLTTQFDRLGLSYVPSVANFLLTHLNRDGAATTRSLMQRGVIVRPMQGYDYPQSIRVTVGLPSQNERFIAALEDVLTEVPEIRADA